MHIPETSYVINLDFEAIKLPPVTDILILGKKNPQGKMGVLHSFHLISPDVFELIEINDSETVEAMIINKSLLSKLKKEEIIRILTEYVFPYISKGEAIRVNLNIQIFQRNIRGDINVCEDVSAER
jgi:hypothetical protein